MAIASPGMGMIIESFRSDVCDECISGLAKDGSIDISKCAECGRVGCADLVSYSGQFGKHVCRPDADDESCMEEIDDSVEMP